MYGGRPRTVWKVPEYLEASKPLKFSIMFIRKITIKGEQGELEGGGVWFS